MPFPTTPLDVKVELQLNSVWTDVTGYVYTRDPIKIERGQADESGSMEPSKCDLLFNNRDGRFSPRNPTGPYYGSIGRNTPCRISARLGTRRLVGSNSVTAPDSAALSITGDIDIRWDGRLPSWAPNQVLISKYTSAGDKSYRIFMGDSGKINFNWSSDGTTALGATSTVPVPQMSGRQAVRATLDVDNGAGGRTITFYTAATAAGPWVQLGDPVVQAGVTSIADTIQIAQVNAFTGWETYSAEIRNGIGGALVANPIFTSQSEGATSFADAQGNTWTVAGAVTTAITDRRYRMYGEVSSWPARWDLSGRDVWVPVTASGITRRLGQGAAPLNSALRRALPDEAGIVAYWPMEDGENSTQVASAINGAPAMAVSGAADFAADSQFFGSAPLPHIGTGVFSGSVPAATAGTIEARFVFLIPAAGITNNSILARFYTSGTVVFWDVVYQTAAGGTVGVIGYTASATGPVATVAFAGASTGVNGARFQAALALTTSGANVAWQFATVNIDTDASAVPAGTVVTASVGAATAVWVNPAGADLGDTVIGHVHTRSSLSANPYGFEEYVRGWSPETPGRRIERLCSENSVPFSARGWLGPGSGTAVGTYQGMGPQTVDTLLALIGSAVTVDGGMLIEPRDALALAYRPHEALYSQRAALALAYGNVRELAPVEDDQQTRNDITVTRTGGSSVSQELTSGTLSTQAPPNGVGRYDEAITLNLATDAALPDQASWRLHMGTVDEARYPVIGLLLEGSAFAASSSLTTSALDLDIGDLITISNPPAWLPPDQIRQIALGFAEVLEPFAWSIEINCAPASPWVVGVYDQGAPASRYAADGATLSAGITSTATGAAALSIVTPAGKPLWTSAAGDFPMNIVMGGEVITLSAIAATASPQAATVSARSVNGVVKAHLAGAAIQVVDVAYYGL